MAADVLPCFLHMLYQLFEEWIGWYLLIYMMTSSNGNIFPRNWSFVRGTHRSTVNSPHKGPWRGALKFSLICALNKWMSKQSWCWWFETPPHSLWRYCNEYMWNLLVTNHNKTQQKVNNVHKSWVYTIDVCDTSDSFSHSVSRWSPWSW